MTIDMELIHIFFKGGNVEAVMAYTEIKIPNLKQDVAAVTHVWPLLFIDNLPVLVPHWDLDVAVLVTLDWIH